MPPQLANKPKPPEELLYIWEWHQHLVGANPLSYQELKAWNDLMGIGLEPWEVEVLRSLDNTFWRIVHD